MDTDMIVRLHIHGNLDVVSLRMIRSLSAHDPIITCVLTLFCIHVSIALSLGCYVVSSHRFSKLLSPYDRASEFLRIFAKLPNDWATYSSTKSAMPLFGSVP